MKLCNTCKYSSHITSLLVCDFSDRPTPSESCCAAWERTEHRMSNAERIRMMDDAELAEFLNSSIMDYPFNKEEWLNWLREDAEI